MRFRLDCAAEWYWLAAMFLIATSSKGVSSLKLSNWLGIQYRTVWHMAHRIRAMMADDPGLLKGIVELDETFIGGDIREPNKERDPAPLPLFEQNNAPPPEPEPPADGVKQRRQPRRKGRGGGKTMAFTAVERGGKARMVQAASHGFADLSPLVRAWVDRAAIISTDELPVYRGIGRTQAGHLRVNHSAGEYAANDDKTGLRAHCNTAESIHAVFKRSLVGVWHHVSTKHLNRYLVEVTHRWNHRDVSNLDRLSGMFASGAQPLSLRSLLRRAA